MRPAPPVSADELAAWLRPALARACQVDPSSVTDESNLLDLGADSLTLVSVLSLVEAEHGIELGPDETLALIEAADVRAFAGALAALIDARKRADAGG
ncbi:MAG TPA: acyl carrier protein [Gammaproteobacteria bacterium]